jgi:hypothetical protein
VSLVQPPHWVPLQGLVPQARVCEAGHAEASPVQVAASVATALGGPPVQLALRHGDPLALNASVGHVAPVPVHVSSASQTSAEGRHMVPLGANASAGHPAPLPLQASARSHAPADGRHTDPLGNTPSLGHDGLLPEQFSATSQGPDVARHTVLADAYVSAGHVADVPLHASSASQAPAAARHVEPAFPAGYWQSTLEPSHWFRVQGLLSLVQAAPAVFLASVGQVALVPLHVSAWSHSPAAARQVEPEFPAGYWQSTLEPSHWFKVHGLPSLVQAVPEDFLASVGQVVLVPVQVSAWSQSPAAARHVTPAFPALC